MRQNFRLINPLMSNKKNKKLLIMVIAIIIVIPSLVYFTVSPNTIGIEDSLSFNLVLYNDEIVLYKTFADVLNNAIIFDTSEVYGNKHAYYLYDFTDGNFNRMLHMLIYHGFFEQYSSNLAAVEALNPVTDYILLNMYSKETGELLHSGKVPVWSLKLFIRYSSHCLVLNEGVITPEVFASVTGYHLTDEQFNYIIEHSIHCVDIC